MKKQQLLAFISNEDLYEQVKRVLDISKNASDKAEGNLFKNAIDPFSAVFDASIQGITLRQWLEQEKARQTQKTLQNALGNFHQEVLGAVKDWESLGTGNIFDLKNDSLKIIAEVKNKYNTTKGNHKVAVYDDLSSQLNARYEGYTAYYVEIIPKNKAIYDKPFTPSDNRTHRRRPTMENIRVIDGKSFYHLATGDPEAIKKLYYILPDVINDILGKIGNTGHSSLDIDDVYSNAGMVKDAPRKTGQLGIYDTKADHGYTELFEKVY
jgi:hypothetical protein